MSPDTDLEGTDDMTKAKARERAKAAAARKAGKKTAGSAPTHPVGKFDSGAGSISGPQQSANIKNFAGARSGSARAR